MAVALTQRVFRGPLYCACVMGDGSSLARDVIGTVIATIPVPVSGGNCPGFAGGMFIAQDAASLITSVVTASASRHFHRLLLLIPGSLQELLDKAPLFRNISFEVVAANCSSVFHLTSSHHLSFQRLTTDSYTVQRQLPNLQGRVLRVSTFHCPPFSYRNSWKNINHGGSLPKGVPDGVEMAIFLALSRRLNFTWQMNDLHDADVWGHRDDNGTWSGGIVESMSQKLADIAFCGIYVEETIMQEMDLTIPWTHYCLTFLVPRSARGFRFAFLKTFQPLLWLFIIIVTLGTAVVMWLLSRFERRPRGIIETVLTAVGLLFLSSFPEQQTRLGTLRLLMAFWSAFSLLLTTALSSGLVSHLTQPAPTTQLNSVRNLVESGLSWGQAYEQDYSAIFNMQDPWHAQFADQFKLESNPRDRVTRVRRGHYAILGGKLDGTAPYFMEGDTLKDTGLLSQLRVMDECLIRQYAALGLIKRSSLTQPVSRAMRWLLEAGLVEHWQADLVQDYGNPEIKHLFHTVQQRGPQQLTWVHLEDLFLLLCIGLATATLMFLIEVFCFRLKLEDDHAHSNHDGSARSQ